MTSFIGVFIFIMLNFDDKKTHICFIPIQIKKNYTYLCITIKQKSCQSKDIRKKLLPKCIEKYLYLKS